MSIRLPLILFIALGLSRQAGAQTATADAQPPVAYTPITLLDRISSHALKADVTYRLDEACAPRP